MPLNSAVRYRTIAEAEHEAVRTLLRLAFSMPNALERFGWTTHDRLRVVEAGGELVTALNHVRLRQWWLGRPVPSAQVTHLAALPQHRGRGYGSELLRGLFAELHDAGIPTVTLFASTGAFYRGVGFEYAGDWTAYEARGEHLPRTTAPYRARQVALDDLADIKALYRRVAPTRHGALDRDDDWWRQYVLRNDPVAFVLDGPDGPAGWVVARLHVVHQPQWGARADVVDWGGLPGVQAALLGLLGGYGPLNGVVSWSGPDPDPAVLALPEHAFRLTQREPWMLRVIDLAAALEARPYPAWVRGSIGFTVEDDDCPWNGGDWVLEIADGEGHLEKGGPQAARAHVRGLAALFSGYQDPAELAGAGLLADAGDEGLAFLRTAFASPRPWTAEHY